MNRIKVKLGSVDNSSSEARRPATCSRDPAILLNTESHYSKLDRNGSREQVAGRRKSNCQRTLLFFSFLIFNVGYVSPCLALPEDSQQVMQLQAGSADLDQQTHVGKFIDNVQLIQGSTHLTAAEVLTEGNEKNQLVKAILKGNHHTQAHYWTLTSPNKPSLHAYADTIHYYPQRHRIELIGNARVEQGENSFTSAIITYDTEHQHVVTQPNSTTRTTIIIHPEHANSSGINFTQNNHHANQSEVSHE